MSKTNLHHSEWGWFRLVLMGLGGIVLLFIVAPVLSLFFQTSPAEMVRTSAETEVRGSIWLTLWVSMAGTVLFSIAAVPLGYLLARHDFPMKKVVSGLIDVPVVIPHSAAGIALLGVIARDSALGRVVERMGEAVMGATGWALVGTRFAIMLAMAFVSIPYLVNAARDGFLAVPRRLELAAMNLGASPMRTFFTISLPMAWRPVLSGLVLMWARGLSEFGAVMIVAYHPMTTPVMIYERFLKFGLSHVRPLAALFILICLTIFTLLRLLAGNGHYAQDK